MHAIYYARKVLSIDVLFYNIYERENSTSRNKAISKKRWEDFFFINVMFISFYTKFLKTKNSRNLIRAFCYNIIILIF